MRMSLQFVFAAIILLSSFVTYAQQNSELTIGAQIRPRAEFRNGFKTLTEEDRDAAFFIEQRTRLFADYNAEKFRVHLNLQDVRIWGDVNQIYKDDAALFNVYEAWGEYRFNKMWSTKMGRMALDYDNARFFGNLGWAAQGRSHDAFLVKYKKDGLKFDLGLAFNQTGFEPTKLSGTFYSRNNYKNMQFVWINKSFGDLNISALAQNDGRQVQADSTTAYRQTFALIPTYKADKIAVGAELYYQMGQNALDNDVNAYLLAAYFTYKTKLTPLTLGVDFVSGTEVADALKGEDNSFAPLYGTNHKFYGFMDYFYVGNSHANVGLTDIYLKTKFKLGKRSNLAAHLHQFMAAVDVADPNNPSSTLDATLGTEVDLVYTIKLADEVGLNIGYSQMFATDTMEAIKGGDASTLNNWAWVQFNFSPTLLKQKIEK